jgi:cell division protein FtsA
LEGITLEPLASAKAVLSQEEKEAGVALIDIGGGTTDLAVFKDGIIRHTAVIPFGGNVITEDIKEGCSIIEKQAELLKIKFGSAWPGENKDNEIVSIPGLRGRDPKEITLKNLSKIIHARVVTSVCGNKELWPRGAKEKINRRNCTHRWRQSTQPFKAVGGIHYWNGHPCGLPQ